MTIIETLCALANFRENLVATECSPSYHPGSEWARCFQLLDTASDANHGFDAVNMHATNFYIAFAKLNSSKCYY